MLRTRIGIEPQNVGAWVKIPGLDPREPHALNFLSIAELDKLAERVAEAKAKAQRQARRVAAVNPGDMVELTRSFAGIPSGAVGVVMQRSVLTGANYKPEGFIPVAFAQHGFQWVLREALVKLTSVQSR